MQKQTVCFIHGTTPNYNHKQHIWHSTFENCGKKYEIYHISVFNFHGNNPKVKVHRGESPYMSN